MRASWSAFCVRFVVPAAPARLPQQHAHPAPGAAVFQARAGSHRRCRAKMSASASSVPSRERGDKPEGDEPGNRLPTRESYHPARKLFHFLTGYMIALAYHLFLSKAQFCVISTVVAGSVLVTEAARLQSPAINKVVQMAFGPFMRAHETSKFSGMFYYMFGCATAAALVSKPAAILGILLLAALDPIAALFGTFTKSQTWARLKNGKSVLGFFFAFLVALNLVFRCAMRSPDGLGMDALVFLKLACTIASCGALTELIVPSPQLTLPYAQFPLGIDDNFLIPVVAACVAEASFAFVGVPFFAFSRYLLF
ncbi:CTP-dependent diacylglycerol kinase 1 [Porphyridium purpureum]|uniref:CTP-dependent diacylglycerol kinase 1 n=1 Tax=Porphyridium purpureum TaxID=35688 RepID=A0A5J4YXT9_PORPP|nr:CTP-dependent diacylglycerol kinase 1 [Porphyridium purpureum]|eukprot:POR1735..scf208_2